MFYRSKRLLLRPIWPEDWPAIKVGIANLAVLRNLASAPYPYNDQDAQEFTRRPLTPRYPRFLITLAADASVLGTIGLDPGSCGDPELGYWLAQPFWGEGYATEAGRGVLCAARSLGHDVLTAKHFVDNPASGKVLRKLGFRPTGTTCEQFSLGRGEAAPAVEYKLRLKDCESALSYAA
ncbi:MAG: GNAT family N-acetyltransferase [Pseudomonadota bacterium]